MFIGAACFGVFGVLIFGTVYFYYGRKPKKPDTKKKGKKKKKAKKKKGTKGKKEGAEFDGVVTKGDTDSSSGDEEQQKGTRKKKQTLASSVHDIEESEGSGDIASNEL